MLWFGTIGDWGFGGSAVFDKALSPWRLATKDQQHLSHPVTSSCACWCHPGTSTRTLPITRHSDVQISETAQAQRAAATLEPIHHAHSPQPWHRPPPQTRTLTPLHPTGSPQPFHCCFCNVKWNPTRGFICCLSGRRGRGLSVIEQKRAELSAFKMLQGDLGNGECPKAGRLLGR